MAISQAGTPPSTAEVGRQILHVCKRGLRTASMAWSNLDDSGRGWTVLAIGLTFFCSLAGGLLGTSATLALMFVGGIYAAAYNWGWARKGLVRFGGWADGLFTVAAFFFGGGTATGVYFAALSGMYFTVIRKMVTPILEAMIAADDKDAEQASITEDVEASEDEGTESPGSEG